MFDVAGIKPKPRQLASRQLSVRFTEAEIASLELAASKYGLRKTTLIQRLVLEWLSGQVDAAEGDE